MNTVACLTPAGAGALATLGLTGPGAWPAVRALFTPRKGALPERPEPGRFRLGRMGPDEVVVSVRQIGPVEVVECHCHGGREVVRWLVEELTARGLTEVGWEDHLRLLGGDRPQALAAIALAHGATARTAAIALDQLNGAMGAALRRAAALAEGSDPARATEAVKDILRWQAVGAHLVTPWRVVLAGPPNVGKSSLLNALAGRPRSIVAATPGTTRDVVTLTLALDGWPVEVADTAGLRAAGETLEGAGVELARSVAAAAELRLWVMDASGDPVPAPADGVPTLVVINKIDLSASWDIAKVDNPVPVSARTGAGITELGDAISRRLVPEPPPAGAAVPLDGETVVALEAALRLAGPARAAALRALAEGGPAATLEGTCPLSPGSDHAAVQNPPG